jgi:DNA-binding Xre family transcriptional regulator
LIQKKVSLPLFSLTRGPKKETIMLEFNLKRIATLKGLKETRAAAQNRGISYQVFNRMLRGKTFKATTEQLEALCLALCCTPNDLYEWKPGANAPENHPLDALRHAMPNLQEKIAQMSLEEIAALQKMMEGK